MRAPVTKQKAERTKRNAAICEEFARLRRMGGDKGPICDRLAARYGLSSNYVSLIVRKGGAE